MIDVTTDGDVKTVRLAHGSASAMDLELCEGIAATFEDVRTSGARAVVLTGTGGIFSAGVNLLRLTGEGEDYALRFLPALEIMIERVFAFPLPVVAAINGHAIAGGCILACAADHRLMARGAGRIGVPELLVGVPFPSIALEVFRYGCDARYAQQLAYGGATHDADEALVRGMVDEVVSADTLTERALAHAHRLAALPTHAFTITKHQLRRGAIERAQTNRTLFDDAVRAAWSTDEARQAIRSYIDRTFRK